MARRSSAQELQAQLARDLGRGEPILYRRVPGGGRTYYDPKRPENPPVTEHYYFRIYKPALSELQREVINQAAILNVKQNRNIKLSLANTWIAKQQSLGLPFTTQNLTLKDEQFKEAYQQFRIVAYNARAQAGLENPDRNAMFQPGSEYHDYLVLMGRRTGLETFPIGESPLHAKPGQTYIDSVVLPYLQREKDATSDIAETRAFAEAAGIANADTMSPRQLRIALNKEGLL